MSTTPDTAPKPLSLHAYREWLDKEHGSAISERQSTYHESVALKVRDDFEASEFWTRLQGELSEYAAEYEVETGYALFMRPPGSEKLLAKGFRSFLLKTQRKNVLNNPNWPSPPPEGWILPANWYDVINDLVRTSFVVKYLDGVEFLAAKISVLADTLGLESLTTHEAKQEGYYAFHVYVRTDIEVPALTWDTTRIRPLIELQVTTQLQDVIRRLLHRYYDDRREAGASPDWQWEYGSDEFVANYLGHILHYVEGMIMDVRDRQAAEKPKEATR